MFLSELYAALRKPYGPATALKWITVNNNLRRNRELMSHEDVNCRLLSRWKSHIFEDNYDDPPIGDLLLSWERLRRKIHYDFLQNFYNFVVKLQLSSLFHVGWKLAIVTNRTIYTFFTDDIEMVSDFVCDVTHSFSQRKKHLGNSQKMDSLKLFKL